MSMDIWRFSMSRCTCTAPDLNVMEGFIGVVSTPAAPLARHSNSDNGQKPMQEATISAPKSNADVLEASLARLVAEESMVTG
ncbi:hypothetical protein [Microbulbifer epialgicus]|uniref:Uncharacterized protein n=1 Tax=Microbulbifer epialgicus TaxID=393907 RepID=A0ABV4NYC2_9GAMM